MSDRTLRRHKNPGTRLQSRVSVAVSVLRDCQKRVLNVSSQVTRMLVPGEGVQVRSGTAVQFARRAVVVTRDHARQLRARHLFPLKVGSD